MATDAFLKLFLLVTYEAQVFLILVTDFSFRLLLYHPAGVVYCSVFGRPKSAILHTINF
jgi:hypothetical protein